jgi:hypothetical protein
MIIVGGAETDGARPGRVRTGFTANLRALEVDQSMFVRAEATNRNRISSGIAKFKRTRAGQGRAFIAIKVEGGFRIWRQV